MTLDELKNSKRWFLWNYSKMDNTGKLTKVPMSAEGGKSGTNSEYEHTWVTYKEALTAHEKLNSSGIGFVVPDGMYFLDIDGRDINNSLVQLFIARHETYAEISPSGNGLHFLGLCNDRLLPLVWDEKKKRMTVAREFYQKNPHNHIELYLGHTVNFKTWRKSYKNKKQLYHDKEDWKVFENTHEAIIDEETFKIVQNIRDGRRRRTNLGEMPMLSGMLYCGDCGHKLYQVRGKDWDYDKYYFVCGTYRKVKGGCTSHQIRNVVMEQILLESIRNVTSYARSHEDEFVELITQKSKAEVNKAQRDSKRELEKAMQRISKLDTIIQKLYEDNVEGKISDERFIKLSGTYEDEQATLAKRVDELNDLMAADKENSLNADHFLNIVRKYTNIEELSAELIREFIEKVYVYQAEKIDGQKDQRVRIIWNCIGEFETPKDK